MSQEEQNAFDAHNETIKQISDCISWIKKWGWFISGVLAVVSFFLGVGFKAATAYANIPKKEDIVLVAQKVDNLTAQVKSFNETYRVSKTSDSLERAVIRKDVVSNRKDADSQFRAMIKRFADLHGFTQTYKIVNGKIVGRDTHPD